MVPHYAQAYYAAGTLQLGYYDVRLYVENATTGHYDLLDSWVEIA